MTPQDTVAEARGETIEVHLRPDRGRSWKGALLSAVIGAGGGPLYRFVAVAEDGHRPKGATAGHRFPLQPFQDLDAPSDDEWATVARRRLAELEADLRRDGWHPRPDRGPHWWSVRYSR